MEAEWQNKPPYHFEVGERRDVRVRGTVGSLDRSARRQKRESCTIITTPPNSHLAHIHNRMTVMPPSGAYASWLNPAMRDCERGFGVAVAGLLARCAATL